MSFQATNLNSQAQRVAAHPAPRRPIGRSPFDLTPFMTTAMGLEQRQALFCPEILFSPTLSLVHPALVDAWRINRKQTMFFVFDAVVPCTEYKEGTVYNEDDWDPFADDDPGAFERVCTVVPHMSGHYLKPYKPIPHR